MPFRDNTVQKNDYTTYLATLENNYIKKF